MASYIVAPLCRSLMINCRSASSFSVIMQTRRFLIIVKNEMIQNDSVKICAKDAQNHRLFIVNQGSRKRHAHAG